MLNQKLELSLKYGFRLDSGASTCHEFMTMSTCYWRCSVTHLPWEALEACSVDLVGAPSGTGSLGLTNHTRLPASEEERRDTQPTLSFQRVAATCAVFHVPAPVAIELPVQTFWSLSSANRSRRRHICCVNIKSAVSMW